ncbi:aldose epimerase family protein [Clostridium cellulovorans]|nr:aldose epimerase family protein [Clostridium cellulovorans]
MSIIRDFYGKTSKEENVDIFTLSNNNNMSVKIINFGGIIVSLIVADKNGKIDDLVLGYEGLEGYIENPPFFGAIIGRHANRIEDSTIEVNGKIYKLTSSEGKNHLHGGINGFHKVLWNAEIVMYGQGEYLELSYISKDGEEGYPGNLKVKVRYKLNDDNALEINYFAVSDKDTVVNLTNHSYFNLSGHSSGNILNHKLKIDADKFTAINEESIPTGEIKNVIGTPLDFTKEKVIGSEIFSDYEQIINGHGYDHNYILNVSGKSPEKAAEVFDEDSGRVMEVYTTKPGIQFYSGNYLNVLEHGKDGSKYFRNSGLCLETQYFPNLLKHNHLSSSILKAEAHYNYTTIYKFSIRENGNDVLIQDAYF